MAGEEMHRKLAVWERPDLADPEVHRKIAKHIRAAAGKEWNSWRRRSRSWRR